MRERHLDDTSAFPSSRRMRVKRYIPFGHRRTRSLPIWQFRERFPPRFTACDVRSPNQSTGWSPAKRGGSVRFRSGGYRIGQVGYSQSSAESPCRVPRRRLLPSLHEAIATFPSQDRQDAIGALNKQPQPRSTVRSFATPFPWTRIRECLTQEEPREPCTISIVLCPLDPTCGQSHAERSLSCHSIAAERL